LDFPIAAGRGPIDSVVHPAVQIPSMRVKVAYADQNESLRSAFPVFGELGEEMSASAGEHRWHLLNLERPMDAGTKKYDRLLIASRWLRRTVFDKGSSVFVLGVRHGFADPVDGFDVNAFDWLAWGTVDGCNVRDPSIELATESDAVEIANLYLLSRAEALPFLRRVHGDSEVLAWVRNVLLKRGEVSVARSQGTILGFASLVGDTLDQLYVLPGQYRRGIGQLLLDWAKTRSPQRLSLYTFQRNEQARLFYESQGFRALSLTDGAGNEETEPDMIYEWIPSEK